MEIGIGLFSTRRWRVGDPARARLLVVQVKWREWLRPGAQRYASGVPMNTAADAMVTAIQPLFGIAVIMMSVITVDPLGLTGRGAAGELPAHRLFGVHVVPDRA